ncbi:MAG: outer membrane protein assembly factor BamE, partial [Sphingomonadales bacterium]
RDSVQAALGSPSSVGTFDDSTWYYISRKTKSIAFLDPELIEQNILSLTFDDEGNLDNIHNYTLADARKVNFVSRETPTRGRELGLLEQLFGNIGRFSGQQRGPGPGGR